jgi:hypothetical protein
VPESEPYRRTSAKTKCESGLAAELVKARKTSHTLMIGEKPSFSNAEERLHSKQDNGVFRYE